MHTLKIPKPAKTCLLFLMANLIIPASYAQFPNILDKANKLIKSGTETVRQVGGLVSTTKKTTAEFNKSVKVVNGNTSSVNSVSKEQITKPKFKRGKFANFSWQPVAQFDGQMFPAMTISMSNYKGDIDDPMMNSVKSSALGFYFKSDQPYIPVRWEIESVDKAYFDKVGGDFLIQDAKQDYYFMPNVPWNMSTLAKQVSSTPVNIIYRLYDESGNKEEHSETIFMRSINDCIYQYQQKSFDFLFTAFIQEQHPQVDKILKEALKTKFVSAISGYQSGEEQTLLQVCAIWKVLHDRGFQYSSITTTSTNSSANIVSQQVRTFDNALKTNQANCVDGTVVFASLLRAIDISTVMVLTHDHCFLGFYTSNRKDRKLVYLETTMLSRSDKIDAAKTPKQKSAAYVAQFVDAIKMGSKNYNEYKAANDLKEIDVDYYRNYVRPLPFN